MHILAPNTTFEVSPQPGTRRLLDGPATQWVEQMVKGLIPEREGQIERHI